MKFLTTTKIAKKQFTNDALTINQCYYLAYNHVCDFHLANLALPDPVLFKGVRFGMPVRKIVWKAGFPSHSTSRYLEGRNIDIGYYDACFSGTSVFLELYTCKAGLYFCTYRFKKSFEDKNVVTELLDSLLGSSSADSIKGKLTGLLKAKTSVSICTNNIFILINHDHDQYYVHVLNFTVDKEGFLF